MKLATFTAAWGWLILGLSQAGAAPAVDAASGVYQVRYPGAFFAFRVDPWSDDVRQIRGVGRAAFGAEDDQYDLFFEILGTYRPAAAHTAQGVFLFRDDDTIRQIPWKGMYDREKKSFVWAVVNQGQVQLLLSAVPLTDQDRAAIALHRQQKTAATATAAGDGANLSAAGNIPTESSTTPAAPGTKSPETVKTQPAAAEAPAQSAPATTPAPSPATAPIVTAPPSSAAPSETTALFQRTPYLKEVLDDKGELDFSRVIIRAIDITPVPKDARPEDKKREFDFGRALINVVQFTPVYKDARSKTDVDAASDKPSPPTASGIEVDIEIIKTLTHAGMTDNQEMQDFLRERLDHDLGISPEAGRNIRKRAEYPTLEPPRVVDRLVKPNSPTAPATPTAPGSEVIEPLPPGLFPRTSKTVPGVKTVPDVVGLSFEGAVNALWGAGLNPTTVVCLGQSTDPEKADRVTSQTPPAGSPYPPDGNMTLQWYSRPTGVSVPSVPQEVTTTPADPAPTAPAAAVGFQPGDGAKVDGRFGGALIYADGKGIAFAAGGQSGMNWSILKLDEPSFQQGIAGAKAAVQNLTNNAKSVGEYVVTVKQQGAGVIEFSATAPGVAHSYCYQYREYRGFLINYAESVPAAGAALGAQAAAAIEKSQQLIDLRFPK